MIHLLTITLIVFGLFVGAGLLALHCPYSGRRNRYNSRYSNR